MQLCFIIFVKVILGERYLYGTEQHHCHTTVQTIGGKIRKEIDAGERAAGSRLPTENELSESYHVSRVTVRKALAVLSESGYLERKSGKGTFVAEKNCSVTLQKS